MKNNLQSRLIVIMVFSTLLLTSVFIFIQLDNQVQKTQEFNVFRAKQGALATKEMLGALFVNASSQELPQSQVIGQIKGVFLSLIESGAVETAVALDKDGNPVILEGKLSLAFEENKNLLEEITAIKDKSKWLLPQIDKEHRIVSLFIAVDNPYGLVFKLIFSLGNLQEAMNQVYGPILFIAVIIIIANIGVSVLLSRALIVPVKVLNQATKDVAAGNLDLKVSLNTKDELEELSDTFNYMTVELKKMKAKAENANPLTKLPGNIVIREEAEKRLAERKKFMLIYADLDNFKAFNDQCGVEAGDHAVMLTAEIMKEAIAKFGKADDFLGHEGGDDFLLLTTIERAPLLAEYIISEFDKRIRSLYSQDDLEKGYIEARTRDTNEIKKFPIMTISLAGVGNAIRQIDSYSQLTNIAAEVKKAAKKKQKSCFVVDQRTGDPGKGTESRNITPPE